jgi:hypothetical protein
MSRFTQLFDKKEYLYFYKKAAEKASAELKPNSLAKEAMV